MKRLASISCMTQMINQKVQNDCQVGSKNVGFEGPGVHRGSAPNWKGRARGSSRREDRSDGRNPWRGRPTAQDRHQQGGERTSEKQGRRPQPQCARRPWQAWHPGWWRCSSPSPPTTCAASAPRTPPLTSTFAPTQKSLVSEAKTATFTRIGRYEVQRLTHPSVKRVDAGSVEGVVEDVLAVAGGWVARDGRPRGCEFRGGEGRCADGPRRRRREESRELAHRLRDFVRCFLLIRSTIAGDGGGGRELSGGAGDGGWWRKRNTGDCCGELRRGRIKS